MNPTMLLNGGSPTIELLPTTASASSTTLALDSAYSFGSAGDAQLNAFLSPETGDLTDFWVKVSGYTGTWANTDRAINVEIRERSATSYVPGTLVGSFTIDLSASPTGWVKKTGLSIALTTGQLYCVIIADADGSASDYCTIVRHHGSSSGKGGFAQQSAITANGFSTAATSTGTTPSCALTVNGVTVSGNLFAVTANLSSNTNERGIRFKVPYKALLVGVGQIVDSFSTGFPWKLYADATAPGGTALVTVDPPQWSGTAGNPSVSKYYFTEAQQYELEADTWYRFVIAPTSNVTTPRSVQIDGSPDSTLLAAAMPLGGNCYFTLQSGSAWVDETDKVFQMMPILFLSEETGGGPAAVEPFRAFIG